MDSYCLISGFLYIFKRGVVRNIQCYRNFFPFLGDGKRRTINKVPQEAAKEKVGDCWYSTDFINGNCNPFRFA